MAVNVSPSTSVGGASPNGFPTDSSATVIALSVATGGSCVGATLIVIVLGDIWNNTPSLTEKSKFA